MINVYSTKENQEVDFTINKSLFITWKTNTIESHKLCVPFTENKFRKLNISLDPDDEESFMKDLRKGKNLEICIIIVHQNEWLDMIIIWNLYEDVEAAVFEIEKSYEIIWDKWG